VPYSFIDSGGQKTDGLGDIFLNYRYQALMETKTQPAFGFDGMLVGETRSTSVFVNCHAQRIDLRTQGRMATDIVNDFAYARKQPRIIQHWLAHGYSVFTQLPRFAHQPGCVG